MPEWRSSPTRDGLVDYINQQIALGKIGGSASFTMSVISERNEWRAAPPGIGTATGDKFCDYVNQQIALGKISAIPASVTAAGLGAPIDWRASAVRTGDPLCDYINQQILLGKINLSNLSPPGSPILWFDAQNIDGTNNSSLTDGQQVGTWLNLGSYGSAANLVQATAGLRPLFTMTAPVLTGKSCLTSDGTKQLQTATFTVTATPVTWLAIARQTGVGAKVVISGASGLAHQIGTNPLVIQVFSGSLISTGQFIVANTWHQLGFIANGASSSGSLDGTASGTVNAGSNSVSSLSAFGDGVGGELMNGTIAEIIAYSGALGSQPTLAQLTTYITTKYGAMPQ